MIGAHGGGLTNGIWMRSGSVVIEVTLRQGYCCEQIPGDFKCRKETGWKEAIFGSAKPVDGDLTANCTTYNFVNFPEMLHASGVHWRYLDPTFIDQPKSMTAYEDRLRTMRETMRVHVDTQQLTDSIRAAYVQATHRIPI